MHFDIAVKTLMSRTRCRRCRVVPPRNEKPTAHADSFAGAGRVGLRAGRRGANLLGLTNPHLQQVYEQARIDAGLDVESAKVLQLHWTYADDTDDLAWERAAPRSGEGEGRPTPLATLAAEGRKVYSWLLREWLRNGRSPALARRARQWRWRAVREVAERLRRPGAPRSGGGRGTDGRGLAYLGLVAAWWGLWRRRVSGEESVELARG